MKNQTLKTNENMKALEKAILSNATLKNELQGDCNVNIDITNKVATLFNEKKATKESEAQRRVEIWLDSRNVVVYVGSNVKATTKESKKFVELFNNSRDMKYRISENIETKHKFESIELVSEFLSALSERVVEESEQTSEKATAKTQKVSKKATSSKKKASKTA